MEIVVNISVPYHSQTARWPKYYLYCYTRETKKKKNAQNIVNCLCVPSRCPLYRKTPPRQKQKRANRPQKSDTMILHSTAANVLCGVVVKLPYTACVGRPRDLVEVYTKLTTAEGHGFKSRRGRFFFRPSAHGKPCIRVRKFLENSIKIDERRER